MNYWERKNKLFKYIDGVRQFFPLAKEQLDTISRIIEKYNSPVKTFLDLGCGDGFLGHFVYDLYPSSEGVFLDGSNEMIVKARGNDLKRKSNFIVQDFGEINWMNCLEENKKFDLIISGFSIHHIANEKKKNLYKDVYHLLNPNGIFLNLEYVSSVSQKQEELFSELFDDRMMQYQKHIGEEMSLAEVKEKYHDPNHKKLNILAPVEKQCEWLRSIGFKEVDCYMKIFELALFGGVKKD